MYGVGIDLVGILCHPIERLPVRHVGLADRVFARLTNHLTEDHFLRLNDKEPGLFLVRLEDVAKEDRVISQGLSQSVKRTLCGPLTSMNWEASIT